MQLVRQLRRVLSTLGNQETKTKSNNVQGHPRQPLSRSRVILHLGGVLMLAIAFYQLSIPIQFLIPFASQPNSVFVAEAN